MLKETTKQQKEKLIGVITIVLVAIIGLMLVSSRISSSRSVSPNAPESKAEASDGGPMCNGTKCCQNCDCINGKCSLPAPKSAKEKIQKKQPTVKTVLQKVFPKKSGKFRAE